MNTAEYLFNKLRNGEADSLTLECVVDGEDGTREETLRYYAFEDTVSMFKAVDDRLEYIADA